MIDEIVEEVDVKVKPKRHGSVDIRSVSEYLLDSNLNQEMLSHKYKVPIETKFKHRLKDFEEIKDRVEVESISYEQKKLQGIMNANNKINLEELADRQIEEVQIKLDTETRNQKQELKKLDDSINNKLGIKLNFYYLDNKRKEGDEAKLRKEILRRESKEHKLRQKAKEEQNKEGEDKEKLDIAKPSVKKPKKQKVELAPSAS